MQAVWTGSDQPVFDAILPRPLYSLAAGHTQSFSQNLVNYFNPAFSWYESLFGQATSRKHFRHSRSYCRAAARTPSRLQRCSTNRDETARPWLARKGQLHLEPLHGYGLERTVPSVFRAPTR